MIHKENFKEVDLTKESIILNYIDQNDLTIVFYFVLH